MTDEGILRQAKELKEYVIDCRRKIHQYAEVSGTEKKTSTFIDRYLRDRKARAAYCPEGGY